MNRSGSTIPKILPFVSLENNVCIMISEFGDDQVGYTLHLKVNVQVGHGLVGGKVVRPNPDLPDCLLKDCISASWSTPRIQLLHHLETVIFWFKVAVMHKELETYWQFFFSLPYVILFSYYHFCTSVSTIQPVPLALEHIHTSLI